MPLLCVSFSLALALARAALALAVSSCLLPALAPAPLSGGGVGGREKRWPQLRQKRG